jgi:phosphopantothenoylcysteine decarboxylase/phosphopantothenate--cysteine ligase
MIQVQTAGEMAEQVEKHFAAADAVIMSAAVSDFRFPKTFPQKIKKNDLPARLDLVRTVDILKNLGRKKKGQILVGFAAETKNVVANALKKLKDKNLDLVVANDISEPGIGFESDNNQASLVDSKGGVVQTPKLSKVQLSREILDRIEVLLGKKT